MQKAMRLCKHPGCTNLTTSGYCDQHKDEARERERIADRRRGTARERGYNYRWHKYSKAFLSRPENKFCKLHLDDGCNILAECVDHIDPPDGPNDRRFWDASNHQAACIHCNSVKGHRKMVGTYEYGSGIHDYKEGQGVAESLWETD